MGKRIFAFIVLILLIACDEDPVIVKSDSPPDEPGQEPEIVEQENDEEDIEEFIEFALPHEKIMINLNMVPILDSYLQAVQDRQQAIEKMTLLPIHAADKNLYTLEFSCQEKQCSYLLLDQTEENRAYLIADLAKLKQHSMAPDNTKILFHFNREHSGEPPLSDIVVIDLDNWEPAVLQNEMEEEVMLDYTWPILTTEWKENNRLLATFPDISEYSDESLEQWKNTEKHTKEIEFSINTTKSTENLP